MAPSAAVVPTWLELPGMLLGGGVVGGVSDYFESIQRRSQAGHYRMVQRVGPAGFGQQFPNAEQAGADWTRYVSLKRPPGRP